MKLSYLSSRTAGYKSILRVVLTHSIIPFNLMKVHLMVAVEGRLFRKWFPAAPNLSYDFVWDKTDVYSQKVYGLSEAFGKHRYILYIIVWCISSKKTCSSLTLYFNSIFILPLQFQWVLSMNHVQTLYYGRRGLLFYRDTKPPPPNWEDGL